MFSIKDIAKEASVSISTVSRALNGSGYVSEDACERVMKAARYFNYKPNSIARSLVTRRSNTIGLMLAHIRSPFFFSVEAESRKLGYNIILCHTNEDIEYEKDYLRLMVEQRVDGIIALPVSRESDHFVEAAKLLPIVFLGRSFDNVNISSVEVDNFTGSYRIMEHCIGLGHRRIGIINGPLYTSTGKKRWDGICQALRDHGLTIDEQMVKEGDFTISGGHAKTMELLSERERPTAIYAANHQTALGVLMALKEKKIRIPEEIALAAFDGFDGFDCEAYDSLIEPKITSNNHPSYEMGATAVKLMCQCIQKNSSSQYRQPETCQKIILDPVFEIRESTATASCSQLDNSMRTRRDIEGRR